MPDESSTDLAIKVVKLLNRGRLDEHIPEVIEAAIKRRNYLRAMEAYEQVTKIDVGDRVRIKDDVRPRYLANKRATVTGISRKTRSGVPLVEAAIDGGTIGKYRGGLILLHGSSFDVIGKAKPHTPGSATEVMLISGTDVTVLDGEGNLIGHG